MYTNHLEYIQPKENQARRLHESYYNRLLSIAVFPTSVVDTALLNMYNHLNVVRNNQIVQQTQICMQVRGQYTFDEVNNVQTAAVQGVSYPGQHKEC